MVAGEHVHVDLGSSPAGAIVNSEFNSFCDGQALCVNHHPGAVGIGPHPRSADIAEEVLTGWHVARARRARTSSLPRRESRRHRRQAASCRAMPPAVRDCLRMLYASAREGFTRSGGHGSIRSAPRRIARRRFPPLRRKSADRRRLRRRPPSAGRVLVAGTPAPNSERPATSWGSGTRIGYPAANRVVILRADRTGIAPSMSASQPG